MSHNDPLKFTKYDRGFRIKDKNKKNSHLINAKNPDNPNPSIIIEIVVTPRSSMANEKNKI